MEAVTKLGIVGFSEGNGHPYSWSAICNGYDEKLMEAYCPYQVIPKYLAKQNWPSAKLPNVQITKILKTDPIQTFNVARATFIQNVCNDKRKFVENLTGVLLARDDAQNHLSNSRHFLNAGLHLYLDKPISITLRSLDKIYDQQIFDGQIFSFSAHTFDEGLRPTEIGNDWAEFQRKVHTIVGSTPNNWNKYSVHLLDPIVRFMLEDGEEFSTVQTTETSCVSHRFTTNLGRIIIINTNCPVEDGINFSFHTKDGQFNVTWSDYFNSFKKALAAFLKNTQRPVCEYKHHRKLVRWIEVGK